MTREEYQQIKLDIENTFKYLQPEQSQPRQSKGAGLKQKELEDLKGQMIKMPRQAVNYAGLLSNLQEQENTIAINAQNY